MKYLLIIHFISILYKKKTTSSQHVFKTKKNIKNDLYYSSDEKYPFPIFTIKKNI